VLDPSSGDSHVGVNETSSSDGEIRVIQIVISVKATHKRRFSGVKASSAGEIRVMAVYGDGLNASPREFRRYLS
jgi:hypothetical protein